MDIKFFLFAELAILLAKSAFAGSFENSKSDLISFNKSFQTECATKTASVN